MLARARKCVKEASRVPQSSRQQGKALYSPKMQTVVSLLRAVNVGGHAAIKMAELKQLYESLKFRDVQTYVQSGNVIFRTESPTLGAVTAKIQSGIEKRFRVTPGLMLRTLDDMRSIVKKNPFAKRLGIEPAKLHVYFLNSVLRRPAIAQLKNLPLDPEELIPSKSEIFIYFPDGAGKSKLPWKTLEKICTAPGTARNWNTVTKLLEIAEQIDSR